MTEHDTFRLYLPLGTQSSSLGGLLGFLAFTVFMFALPFTVAGPDAPPAFIGFFPLLILGLNLFWILESRMR